MIHFTGIGGIGMSALARYFLAQNIPVSGSDSSESPLTEELRKEGIIWIEKDQKIPEKTTLQVYSEAVPTSDIQRISAQEKNIPSRSYFQQLGEISKKYKTIAICGTHGKSTTTAMTGIALTEAGVDPLVIVGTKVREFRGKNIHIPSVIPAQAGIQDKQTIPYESKNKCIELDPRVKPEDDKAWFIVEACEYRESFLHLHPFGVILTNCEHDHADYYKTEVDYIHAFKKFVSKIPKKGFLVANIEDANVQEVIKSAHCQVIPVEFSKIQNPIKPKVPGKHNRMNAELALAACKAIHDSKSLEEKYRLELSKYSGTWRRFDILGEKNGVTVIDDYGHHPTEVRATLKALKEYAQERRIVVVFQAHQYSRTRELFDDFVRSFTDELVPDSKLFITDIYEARDSEEDKRSVSAEMLAQAIKAKGTEAEYSGNYEQTLKKLHSFLQSGDILLTMGAGPVNQVAESFLK